MKFLAFDVDFNGPSIDFLRLRKPALESIQERYSQSRYFTAVG